MAIYTLTLESRGGGVFFFADDEFGGCGKEHGRHGCDGWSGGGDCRSSDNGTLAATQAYDGAGVAITEHKIRVGDFEHFDETVEPLQMLVSPAEEQWQGVGNGFAIRDFGTRFADGGREAIDDGIELIEPGLIHSVVTEDTELFGGDGEDVFSEVGSVDLAAADSPQRA